MCRSCADPLPSMACESGTTLQLVSRLYQARPGLRLAGAWLAVFVARRRAAPCISHGECDGVNRGFSISSRFPKHRLLLAIAAVALAGVTFHFAVISDAPLPDHRYVRGYNDLVLHAGAFTALTLVTIPAFTRPAPVTIGIAAFAVLLELAQLPIDTRTASWTDLAAGIFGIGLGRLTLILGLGLSTSVQRSFTRQH
mgnify:FL=1